MALVKGLFGVLDVYIAVIFHGEGIILTIKKWKMILSYSVALYGTFPTEGISH